jgi:hypothetical protein
MNRVLLLAVFTFITFTGIKAQSVGIGTLTPHNSAILDVTSNSKGFLLPRMGTVERMAIPAPLNGLLAYDTDLSSLMLFSTSTWRALTVATDLLWARNGNHTYNVLSGNVGIGTSSPLAKLDVTGTVKIADGTQGLGKVLTSNADGLASWQTPTGGGAPAGLAFKAVAGNTTNGLSAYDAFLKLPFMNINTVGYNIGTALSNDGKAIFTAPGNGVFHFDVRLHFSTDLACQTNYSIRFLKNGSIATDAQKNGRLIFATGFDIQEALVGKDFLLGAGDTIEVEFLINVPSPVPTNFWMVGSVANLTSSFTGFRILAF